MAYIIQSSEKTRASCSEFETKALLYLLTQRYDSSDIYFFAVDFFNDLTGLDRHSRKAWDLQSKAAKKNYQGAIGKELVTLFKNYVSPFGFDNLVLFLGGVADSIRKDNSLNVFGIENIEDKSLEKIKRSLIEECKKKIYIDDKDITDDNIDGFFDQVTFVIDDLHDKTEYIKKVVSVSPKIIPDSSELAGIFNQIRDAQSAKKNYGNVEGTKLSSIDEFVYFGRHLTSSEIRLMVLNRMINSNIMDRGMPQSFADIITKFDMDKRRSIMEDCQHSIALTLFDKNNADNFWKLFSEIYEIILNYPNATIDELYLKLKTELLEKATHLDLLSTKYFLALIKDGVYGN